MSVLGGKLTLAAAVVRKMVEQGCDACIEHGASVVIILQH